MFSKHKKGFLLNSIDNLFLKLFVMKSGVNIRTIDKLQRLNNWNFFHCTHIVNLDPSISWTELPLDLLCESGLKGYNFDNDLNSVHIFYWIFWAYVWFENVLSFINIILWLNQHLCIVSASVRICQLSWRSIIIIMIMLL